MKQVLMLHKKCGSLTSIIQLAVEEQAHCEHETQVLLTELEAENRQLR
jgi:hypothetical protein